MTRDLARLPVRRIAKLTKVVGASSARRPTIGFATNGMSSVGNLLLAVAVARSESVFEFGKFAVAFSLYVLITGLCRAAITDTELALSHNRVHRQLSTRWIVTISSVCGLMALVAGIATHSWYLTILAVTAPGLSVYEHIKAINLGIGHPLNALFQETFWTSIVACLVVMTLYTDSGGVGIFAGWAGSGCAVGLINAARLKYSLRPGLLQRGDRRTATNFGLLFLAGSGMAQLTTSALAGFAGATVVAAIRGGGTLLAPTTLVLATAKGILIPYLARFKSQDPRNVVRKALVVTAGLTALISPLCAALLFLPDSVGRILLGETWAHTKPLVPMLAGELMFACITAVAVAAHRVYEASRSGLAIEGAIAPFRVVAIVWAGHALGARGAAFAMLLVALIGTTIWWVSFLRIARRYDWPILHDRINGVSRPTRP